MYKFRSMRLHAEKNTGAVLSSGKDDPRVTKIGRFMRKTRLDELPQLINIIKGDMAIVGPRPERPEIAEKYTKELPEFRLRLQVRAGLTGYAQVYGRYDSDPYDKLCMDLHYIANAGIVEDLRIMFVTFKRILFKEPEGNREEEND
jgi:lipopolysaccharide/colanic/teichoic acid biosynthesis glycosyltransferase